MRRFYWIALFWAALLIQAPAFCQKSPSNQKPTLPPGYTLGPTTIPLNSGEGSLQLPKGFLYIDAEASRKMLVENKQPAPPNMLGIVTDPDSAVEWYSVITSKSFGHIKDDDAEEILKDPSGLLDQLKKTTEQEYANMPSGAAPAPTIIGWLQPPQYDKPSRTLNTSVVFQEPGLPDQTINFTTMVLGRSGGMTYTVVGSKKDSEYIQSKLQQLNTCIRFMPGHDYSSWQPSDGTSDISFTGLVTGGAAVAVAAKTGILAKLGGFLFSLLLALKKAVILVIAGIGAAIRWIKSKLTGQPNTPSGGGGTPPVA